MTRLCGSPVGFKMRLQDCADRVIIAGSGQPKRPEAGHETYELHPARVSAPCVTNNEFMLADSLS
jgi:hypothetical protein